MLVPLTILICVAVSCHGHAVKDLRRFQWRTDVWGSCYVERGCGEGQRERKVWCQDVILHRTVTLVHCNPRDEHSRTKPCFVACRHHKDHLEWRVGDWGPCLAADSELSKMGAGSMERNVTCVLTSHEGFQNSLQIDEENCLVVSTRPETQRDCTLPTQQDCVLTEWSAWTACCDSTQHRTRSVLVAPHYGGQPCPQLSEWRSCEVEDNSIEGGGGLSCAPHTEGVRLRVERWGECHPSPHEVWEGENSDRADNYYKHWPQVGTQRREFTCLNVNGTTVPLSACTKEKGEGSLPPRERACILAQDCSVSEWTDWIVVQEGCVDTTGNVWAELTERRREVLRLHEGQGLPCPHLVETKSTTSNLPLCSHKYRWLASKWSACTLPNVLAEVVCGGGLQFRNITCVAAQGGQPLPTKACHTIPPPPTVQRCEVACPRDCEVGPWGGWGPCLPLHCPPSDQANLSSKGHRKRARAVVVPPSALGLECPSLTEVQPCAHPACYSWTLEPWGACQLEPGTGAKCGTGRRTRRVACTTHSDATDFKEVVADWLCTQLMPPTEEPCLLPCPYDCVVSGWSSWSPCSQACSTRNKMAMRYRNRTIIAPHGPGGHPCPDPDEMLQMDGCNSHGCHGYSWLTLPWQACNASCDSGEGVQTREVWCVQDNQDMVNESKCELLAKPVTSRSCVQDCPVQCEVSPWSEWSPCPPHNCQPNGTRAAATSQSRYRVVVEGSDCGPLEEIRECFTPSDPCPHHTWSTGEWSQCQLAHDVRCGHGLRTRDLWCSEDTDRKAELRLCLATKDPLPVTVQRCHVDCHVPCQLTEWSSWSLCKQPCAGARSRTRQLIGLSEGHAVCQEMPLVETKPCPCEMYYSRPVSNWSSCLTNGSLGCGLGTRYRAVGCYNDRDQMVDPSLCGGGSGLQEEPCLVPCPLDCQLNEWTAWGECNVKCGPGLQNRTRQVSHPGNAGGRQCGPLTQWKLCQVPCELFQWQAGGWSECILIPADRKLGCGTGDQYRQVRCMDTRSDIPVDDDYCDWTTQPVDINACHVACPGDCVLSAWSEWSSCPKGCIGNGQQQRTRSLLRAAATRGATCQHTIQTQACQLNITCFTYHWVVTNFSSCLPLGGSPCGEGMTTRAIYCQRSDSRPVEDSWCSEETKPTPAEKWCYVDCPVDCHVAEWSEWNATQCHCGETGVSRHAFISTNPSSSGRPCPSPLVQWKPCPAVPCYSWQTGSWSECQLHGAMCGHGVRNRNITCVRGGDNSTVDSWHCSGAASRKPVSWETCHVPCDSDCQLSEWSHWSHCHGDCLKDTTGYATRSRAVLRPPQSNGGEPCPEALWETRTCDLGPCLTFSWTIAPNGQIVCQRSDGLHVVGGCDGKRKPTLCEWKGGRCNCIDGAVVQPQFACLEQAQVQARLYYPKDDDLNVWMFAMIGIGCVFIVFVAASIFLLWSVYSRDHPCKENADECHLLGINDGKTNLNDDDDS